MFIVDKSHYEKEVPFEVPESWEWCEFSDLYLLISGRDLEKEEFNDRILGIPYLIGASSLNNGQFEINRWTITPKVVSEKDDLLITCKGTVGNLIINDIGNVHIARQFMAVRSIGKIETKYTRYFFEYSIETIKARAKGVIPGISRKDILEIYIPLPPLSEQKRIVAQVEKLFRLIEIVEENKSSLEEAIIQTKSKILELAIKGKLVSQNPEDEPASTLLDRLGIKKAPSDTSHYPFEIPGSWAWCGLHEIADVSLGKTLDKQRNTGTFKTYLRSVNVRWGFIDLDDVKEMRFEESEEDRYSLQFGDLLICEGGEAGRAAIWKHKNKSMRYQNALHRARFKFGIKADFYLYVLRHYQNTKILDNYTKGVTIKHLTGQALRQMSFPLPPIKEQQRIVEKIEEIYMLLDQIKDNLQTDS